MGLVASKRRPKSGDELLPVIPQWQAAARARMDHIIEQSDREVTDKSFAESFGCDPSVFSVLLGRPKKSGQRKRQPQQNSKWVGPISDALGIPRPVPIVGYPHRLKLIEALDKAGPDREQRILEFMDFLIQRELQQGE